MAIEFDNVLQRTVVVSALVRRLEEKEHLDEHTEEAIRNVLEQMRGTAAYEIYVLENSQGEVCDD